MKILSNAEEDVLKAILQHFVPNDENFVSITYDVLPAYTLNSIKEYLDELQYNSIIASYSQTLSDVDINLTPNGIAYFKNKKNSMFPKNSRELLKELLEQENPVDYMQYLFNDLDSKMDSRLRAMMRDLKEKDYIVTWADNVPYYIEFNEKAYEFDAEESDVRENGTTIIYNITNGNANINSIDNSVRNVNISNNQKELFEKMLNIATTIIENDKDEVVTAIMDMEKSYNQPNLKEKYYKFIEVAANHMSLFAPFIPMLTEMIKL